MAIRGDCSLASRRPEQTVASCAAEVSNETHTSHWVEMLQNGRLELWPLSAHDPNRTVRLLRGGRLGLSPVSCYAA